jgi:hypothetical protein
MFLYMLKKKMTLYTIQKINEIAWVECACTEMGAPSENMAWPYGGTSTLVEDEGWGPHGWVSV